MNKEIDESLYDDMIASLRCAGVCLMNAAVDEPNLDTQAGRYAVYFFVRDVYYRLTGTYDMSAKRIETDG